jgi:hypothetical protein
MPPAPFLTASIRVGVEPVDMTFHLLAAADTGSGNFIVGLLLGLCIGLLVAPAFRSWVTFREWTDASREAKLADRLLTKLETEAEEDAAPSSHTTATPDGPRTPSRTEPRTPAWPTSR